jgi:hypothetical protein
MAIKAIMGYMHWEDRRFDAPTAYPSISPPERKGQDHRT